MDLKNIVMGKKLHIYLYEIETGFYLHEIQIEVKLIFRNRDPGWAWETQQ